MHSILAINFMQTAFNGSKFVNESCWRPNDEEFQIKTNISSSIFAWERNRLRPNFVRISSCERIDLNGV